LLLRTALERMKHFSVQPYTPVSRVDYDSSQEELKYTVATTKGSIRAKVVLHATNGYASHILPSLAGKDGVVGCKAHMLGIA
jgi:glycine/D-amino acid oxidase-like deaminating enzyme